MLASAHHFRPDSLLGLTLEVLARQLPISMPAGSDNPPASILLVEECFAAQDAGFLAAFRSVRSSKWLAAFADRWKKDPRPWAREQIFAYLDLPLNCPGHHPVPKRLFKHAEETRDSELLGAFLVAFDTLVRRNRRQTWTWNRELRQSMPGEVLHTPHNSIPREGETRKVSVWDYNLRKMVTKDEPKRMPRNGRLYTHRTRHYLRRRAWRFFRWMGYRDPAGYPAAVAMALRRYRDEDLAKGENILDSWALLNVCFRGSAALIFGTNHISLVEGHALSELKAAPRFALAWDSPQGSRVLHGLIAHGRSQLVRMWAMEMFRRATDPIDLNAEELLALLDHDDDRVQQFGAELFGTQRGLEKLPLETWLRLLKTKNLTALAVLCEAFEKHVIPDRLTVAQCVEMTCAKPVPVARLGFRLLRARQLAAAEHPLLANLADAQAEAVAGEIATWALERLGTPETYQLDVVSRFFDSLVETTRDAAWAWLIVPTSPGYRDAALWSRLSETPFDDLRLKLVDHLALREKRPDPDRLVPVWCAVLLSVHRGGRQKLKATRQIADAIVAEPARAEALLPVLSVAARSIRGPEMRAGLAAVMTLMTQRPDLEGLVRARFSELGFELKEVSA